MQILSVKSQNFRSYDAVDLDLSGVKLASIIGRIDDDPNRSNGAGKSSISAMVAYALWDYCDVGDTAELVTWWNQNKMWVEVEMMIGGNKILVRRCKNLSRKTGQNELEVSINGDPQGKNYKERTAILAEIVGIDFKTASATWLFQQGEANRLTSSDPAERKRYLSSVIGADQYEKAHKHAKQRYDEARQRTLHLPSLIEHRNRMLAEIASLERQSVESDGAIISANSEIESLNSVISTLSSKIAMYEDKMRSARPIQQIRQELSSIKADVASTDAKIHQKREAVSRVESSGKRIEADSVAARDRWAAAATRVAEITSVRGDKFSQDSVDSLSLSLSDMKAKLTVLKSREDALTRSIDQMYGISGSCPTCKQKVGQDHIQSHISVASEEMRLLMDEMMAVSNFIEVQSQQIESTKAQLSELDRCRATMLDNEQLIQRMAVEMQSLVDRRGSLNSEIDTLSLSLASLVEADERKSKELAEAEALFSSISTIELDQKNLVQLKQRLSQVISSRDAWMAKKNQSVGVIGAHRQELSRISPQIDQCERDKPQEDAFRVVAEMFHRDGLPLRKISMISGLIEVYANELIADIMPKFSVQVSVTDGEGSRGTLDFRVMTPYGVKPYGVFSGGEKKVVDVCLRMALSRILAEGVGRKYETLFLDEIFADLDSVNRDTMMRLVKRLSGFFRSIYVISHEKEVQSSFPQVLLVTRGAQSGTIKLVNN